MKAITKEKVIMLHAKLIELGLEVASGNIKQADIKRWIARHLV